MRKSFLVLWLAVGSLLVFFWVYFPSLSKYRDLKDEQQEIEREIRGLETKIRALTEERDLLKNDAQYLEKVIRDELGLVKPGEIIYKFVPEKKPAGPDPAAQAAPPAERAPSAPVEPRNSALRP